MNKKMKVICFGTFDILHLGHINFFKQAKSLGDKLIVVIARDNNIKKKIIHDEVERKGLVESIKYVDTVILGDRKDFLKPIVKIKPEVICLGYDQPIEVLELKQILKKKGIEAEVKRLKPYLKHKHKGSIIKKKIKTSI